MRNKLVKARPNSLQKLGGFFSIHSDEERSRKSTDSARSVASVVVVVPTDTSSSAQADQRAPAATPEPRSPPAKTAKPQQQPHERPSFRSTLTPASEGAVNSVMPRSPQNGAASGGKSLPSTPVPAPAPISSSLSPTRVNSTIRAVPSFDERTQRSPVDDSSSDGTTQSHSTSRNSNLSSSINSNASMSSSDYPHDGLAKTPSSSQYKLRPSASNLTSTSASPNTDTPTRALRQYASNSGFEIPIRESSISATALSGSKPDLGDGGVGSSSWQTPNEASISAGEAQLSKTGWDDSVGKAGLGKTGRVINRLVSDNESLKREIKSERAKAEESLQTAKLLKDKLDRTISEYESRLLEANVTKTLLARKERQVETLQASVELERSRAVAAADRERVWKDELEKTKSEAKRQVEEATNYAALCEGRYNAISSHWKDQGEEVQRKITKMREEIDVLAKERKMDDEKIVTLHQLCDQQDANIRELQRQKEAIGAHFEAYKREQELALKDIKTKAAEREAEQERIIEESKAVLAKLKWSLSVKDNVSWAG
ncbi:hypothetical protein QBC35DRAFT_104222 [Podospora australis]|uniref:SWI5-dependent HO expression protein 3 n=1 Tax=Podospora australis TaxID=1536484 RepID=A0AAN6X5E5_9PEZI|nr:hypothetical protein QBC35DRAFT_104222 [Podospora australis]